MTPLAPLPCILDTDPGVDDVLAILLALSSPHLLVLGITLTHGNTTLPATAANLHKLFYALEKELEEVPGERERYKGVDEEWRRKNGAGKIQVFLGSEGPIEGDTVTAKYFHGQDGLANIDMRHPDLTPPPSHVSPYYTLSPLSALEGVNSILAAHDPETIAYVALGPLTSLAELHLSSAPTGPSTLEKFRVIVSMGGAVAHPGNTTPVSEYNYYADPFAASMIFSLSLPHLYIFPLDTTTSLTLPFSLYTSLVDPLFVDTSSPSFPSDGKPPLVHFTSAFLEGTREVMRRFGGEAMELHDPTVVGALIEWVESGRGGVGGREGEGEEVVEGEFAPGWGWKRVEFEVETHGTLTRGMLVRDLRSSATATDSLSSVTGLTNRAQAVEALDIEEVEAREAEGNKARRSGARVVLTSPGSGRLRGMLLKGVWGVEEE